MRSRKTACPALAGQIDFDAASSSSITAVVASVSAAVGVGTAGVGVWIGASVARNYIGGKPDGTSVPAEVQAYSLNSELGGRW